MLIARMIERNDCGLCVQNINTFLPGFVIGFVLSLLSHERVCKTHKRKNIERFSLIRISRRQ